MNFLIFSVSVLGLHRRSCEVFDGPEFTGFPGCSTILLSADFICGKEKCQGCHTAFQRIKERCQIPQGNFEFESHYSWNIGLGV